jgi:hypothetical protein
MKYLKEMCDLVNRLGTSKKFSSLVPEARSIVINNVTDLFKDKIDADSELPEDFYPPPFKICAFEFHGKDWLMTGGDRLKCMVINEIGPNEYEIFSMLYELETKKNVLARASIVSKDRNASTLVFINSVTSLLNFGARGSQETKDFVRIKNKYGKIKKHFIRKIVYICSKNKKEELIKKGLKIDWTHRWEVRGHWRDISGLGKDRAGDYCVEGKTWVTEHVKGPEDQPFIKKTRILDLAQIENKPQA